MKFSIGSAWAGAALRASRCVCGTGLAVAALLAVTSVAGRAQTSYTFTPQAIQTTSPTQTVQVRFQAAGQITAINVVAQGVAALDFQQDTANPPSTPCQINQTYAKGDTCNVAVKFMPQYPGPRQGAIVVASTPNSVLATVFLSGTGQGALEVMTPGVINTFAGNSHWSYDGDGKQATAAALYLPESVQMDAAGNLYIVDQINNRIRMVNKSGIIQTVAGNGTAGFTGDGGLATAAELNLPGALVVDGAGNLYISDTGNHVIRRVDAVTKDIATIAGQAGHPFFSGDGGLATDAYLDTPEALAVDAAGNLYIADAYNSEVRRIDVSTGIITAYAGMGGNPGYTGDGGLAISAQVNAPWGIAFGPDGSLYIADLNNNCVRKVDPAGVISTVAGTGEEGFTGDGGAATQAKLDSPGGVTVDAAGNLYIADSTNNMVRKVVGGIINSIVGRVADSATGDGFPSIQGGLYAPYGMTLDGLGNLYIADMLHNLVRVVSSSQVTLTYDTIRQGRTSAPQTETIENDGNVDMTLNTLNMVSNVALDPNAAQPCSAPMTMSAGTSCNLGVEFMPTETGTLVTGQLKVETTAFNTPATINLQGQVLSTDPTTTILTPSANPATVGVSVVFTATVKDTNSITVLPTGTVEFFDGTTPLGSGPVNQASGVATFSTSSLTLGTHSITAVYSGDDNNYTSTSAAVNEVIKQASSTALATSGSPSLAGQSVTFTATVTAPTGTPTGTVTFKDGATTLRAGVALSGGVATYATSALTAAGSPHSITAVYSGDGTNNASTSNPVTQAVNLNASTTLLGTSNSEVVAGASITLTATVTSSGPAPTGTVTFKDGATTLGTAMPLNGSGTATLDLTTLTVGTHTLTAVYSGDTSDATSTSAGLTQTIDQIATATALAASANPAAAGAKLTLTATVTPAQTTGGTLGGSVAFKEGSTTLGTGTVNATTGVATVDLTTLPVGAHTIVAVYSGATNFKGSSSSLLGVTIQQATTGTALISSQNPQTAGKAVTFTATVTGNGGIATGTVTFKDGTTTLGTGTLNGQGVAELTLSSLTAGSHNITAVYGGDVNDAGSSSNTLNQTVQQTISATVLNASPLTVTQGALLSLTATVSGDAGTPGGTVEFKEGATVLGTGTLNGVGVASFSTSALPSGSHSLTAVYDGDTNHSGSTSAAVTVKVLPTTTVSLTANLNPAPAGAAVVLTAAVSGQASVPTGTVTFKDGANNLGTVAVDGTGRASLPTTALSIGTHSLTASYSGDGTNAASVSTVLSEKIEQATTETQLTTSAQNPAAGAKVTLTASVTGNGGVPGGQVTFKDGATVLGTATLNSSGLATLAVSTLNVATHTITAVYAGDTNDAGSTSNPATVVVQQAATAVSVSSTANPATATVPVTLHAAVTGGDAPTGQVTFKDGATVLGTMPVDSTAVASLTTSSLAVGAHNIVAVYLGDVNNAGGDSAVFVETVQAASSAVALTSSANPSLYQSPLLLTAAVTAAAGTPTGTVTFSDGTTALGSTAVNSAGVATLSVSTLAIGPHTIVAAYSGDASRSASQSAGLNQSVLQQTTTALTASVNPATATAHLVLTAKVTGQNGVAPTGTVTFTDGATTLGSAAVNGAGIATLDLTTLAVGSHTIVAAYSGDTKSQASSSAVLAETVISATTQVSLTASANPATAGTSLTFTAHVVSLIGGAPTGSVAFMDGTAVLGSAPLASGGVAILTTTTLAPGPHTITAVYSGDAENSTSTSAALSESVLQTTTTALTSSLNPAQALDAIALTATVVNGGSTPATGSVTFIDGAKTLGTVTLTGGVAVLQLPSLAAGTHSITANYSGDAQNFASTSTALTQTVTLRPTTETLTATTVPPGINQQVTLISVVRWTGPTAPTGTVTFTSGGTALGTSTVDSTGVATLTINLIGSSMSVVSSYSGDASYAPSASTPTTVSSTTPTQFTITADSTAATVQSKQYTIIHITITSENGFADLMKLGCLGLPYAATCTFSADSVNLPADGKQTVTLTLDTGSPLTAGGEAKVEHGSPLTLAWLLPGGLLLGLAGWRGRRRLGGLVLLVMAALVLTTGLTGCAGGLTVNGTPTGSYTVKITATGNTSGATELMNYQLTVQ